MIRPAPPHLPARRELGRVAPSILAGSRYFARRLFVGQIAKRRGPSCPDYLARARIRQCPHPIPELCRGRDFLVERSRQVARQPPARHFEALSTADLPRYSAQAATQCHFHSPNDIMLVLAHRLLLNKYRLAGSVQRATLFARTTRTLKRPTARLEASNETTHEHRQEKTQW